VPDPGSEPPKESSGKGPGLRTRQRNERREQGHPGQALRPGGIRSFGVLHGRSPRRAQTARGDGPRGCAAEEDGSVCTSAGSRCAQPRAGPHHTDDVTGCREPAVTDRAAGPDRTRHVDASCRAGRCRGSGCGPDRYPDSSRWRPASRPSAGACSGRRHAGSCSRAASGCPGRSSGRQPRHGAGPYRRTSARRWHVGPAAPGCTSSRPGRTASGVARRPRCSATAHQRPAARQQPVLLTAGHGACGSAS